MTRPVYDWFRSEPLRTILSGAIAEGWWMTPSSTP
jgi:hypothetical protein